MLLWVEERREAGVGMLGQERSDEAAGEERSHGASPSSLCVRPVALRPSPLWTLRSSDRTIFPEAETEQDAVVPLPHVPHLPSVCGQISAKEANLRSNNVQK